MGWKFLWNQLKWRLDKRPKIAIGSLGPFFGKYDFCWFKYYLFLHHINTHFYSVGKSGKGKSKYIENIIWQYIALGKGCGLVDPHADLAHDLLSLLAFQPIGKYNKPWLSNPKNANKVIYCDPGRKDFLIPFNVLATKNQDEAYAIANNVIEAFERTWPSVANAPQFKNIMEHSLLLLIEHGLTLVELPKLLTDATFRNYLLARSKNQDVIDFFKQRFDKWGSSGTRLESILNKVTALTLNSRLKMMLGATENRLDLRQIMDEGKVLILNLGTCDRTTRKLIGSLFMVFSEQAAMSRANIEMEKRKPWVLFADEFQNWITQKGSNQVVSEMLSETRKMKLHLWLIHQGWHQLGSGQLEGAIDQAQHKSIFGSGHKTAKAISEEIFNPSVAMIENNRLNKEKTLFMRAIKTQRRQEVYVSPGENMKVIGMRTLNVPKPTFSREQLEAVKIRLLKRKGVSVEKLRQQIEHRHWIRSGGRQQGEDTSQAPKKLQRSQVQYYDDD